MWSVGECPSWRCGIICHSSSPDISKEAPTFLHPNYLHINLPNQAACCDEWLGQTSWYLG